MCVVMKYSMLCMFILLAMLPDIANGFTIAVSLPRLQRARLNTIESKRLSVSLQHSKRATTTMLFSTSASMPLSSPYDDLFRGGRSTLIRMGQSFNHFNRGKLLKGAVTLLICIAIFAFFGPDSAAAVVTAAGEVVEEVVAPVMKARKKGPKILRVVKNILDGANMKGSKKWRAGDSRTEVAALLNSFSGIIILGAFAGLAFIGHKAREIKFDRAMSREVIKVKEYKEKMYFEAVQEILDKLADPKMKGSAKANYQRQLKDLDPEGKIVKYLNGEADKPDLTSFIEKNSAAAKKAKNNKKKKSRDDGIVKSPPPTSQRSAQPTAKPTAVDKNFADASSGFKPGSGSENSDGNGDKRLSRLYAALNKSLADVMSDERRAELINYIQGRLEKITDEEKKLAAAGKISERLGDDEYWISYAEKLGL